MERQNLEPMRILVIAGTDSSGGAGLEADQKVIAAHGCYAMTAATALTAQNTQGVSGIHYIPSDFVVNQIDACINDIGVDVVKIGMLSSASTITAVANALTRHKRPCTVLDPVMVSTSGAQLLPSSAISNLLADLLPLTTILTPNIAEAKLLLHHAHIPAPHISSLADLVDLATRVQSLGPRHVLLKGGHFPFPSPQNAAPNDDSDPGPDAKEEGPKVVVDILVSSSSSSPIPTPQTPKPKITLYQTPHIPTPNTHGTGCSLASAIACNIALSPSHTNAEATPTPESDGMSGVIADSVRYIEGAIRGGREWRMGKGTGEGGNGPIDHFWRARRAGGEGYESGLVRWEWKGNEKEKGKRE